MEKGPNFDAHRRTRRKKVNTESFLRFPKTSFWIQSRCIKSLRSGKCQNREIPPSISKAFYASRLSPIGSHSKSVQNVSKSIKKLSQFKPQCRGIDVNYLIKCVIKVILKCEACSAYKYNLLILYQL